LRVVIDTNVFVSSFFGGKPRSIIDRWKNRKLTLCLSEAILEEYKDVLARLGLAGEPEFEELKALFKSGFNLVFAAKPPQLTITGLDPGDAKFVECAVGLEAELIITGNKSFLAAAAYQGIRIISPGRFLEESEP
jgi:uncharacterized protein